MNYYQFHIGDFNNATRHLSRLERSIYRDLIDLYYDTEEPLTNDITALCRKVIATTEQDRTAVQQVLNEYFTETENGWINDRCQDEIDKYHSNHNAKSAAGKASGAARRAKKHTQPVDNKGNQTCVEQSLNGCSDSFEQKRTNQEPITSNQEPVTKEKKGRFTPPLLQDLQSYITEKNLNVDPDQFIDFYESKGWMVGKNKMKSWEASARTWSKRQTENPPRGNTNGKSRTLSEVERVEAGNLEREAERQRREIIDITPH